jgi:hypothetical protein
MSQRLCAFSNIVSNTRREIAGRSVDDLRYFGRRGLPPPYPEPSASRKRRFSVRTRLSAGANRIQNVGPADGKLRSDARHSFHGGPHNSEPPLAERDCEFESGSLQRRVGETFGPSAEDAGFSARLASLVKHTGGLDDEAVKALKTWQSAHHPASIGAPGKALCAMSRLDDIDTKAANLSASAI